MRSTMVNRKIQCWNLCIDHRWSSLKSHWTSPNPRNPTIHSWKCDRQLSIIKGCHHNPNKCYVSKYIIIQIQKKLVMEELFSHGFPTEKSLPSAMPCWLSSLAEPWPRQYLRNRSFSGFPSGLIRSNVVKTTMLCWATIVGSCWITILGKTLVNHLQNNHQ